MSADQTSVLLLRLDGPMQSWGDSSRFARRQTRSEPTKSGVLGLLAAALGRRRSDPIEDLAGLRFGVRVDQRGRLTRDFQTAIRWGPRPTPMPLSHRYYLSDAVFVAGVEGDAELIAGLDEAIQAPAFPLFLGRRSCPPSHEEISLGIDTDRDLEAALRRQPWLARTWYRRQQGTVVHLELLLDATVDAVDVESARDVPISFNPERREYGWRDIERPHPVVQENPDGRLDRDFMAALGGG